jgi:hypothetical protein
MLAYDRAVLVGIWLEGVLYGLYIPLFFICVYILVAPSKRKPINVPMLAYTCIMFSLATAHIGIGVRRLLKGFFIPGGDSLKYFTDLSQPLNLAGDFIYVTNHVIGDSLIAYRLYIVWSRKKSIVVLPCLLFLATAALGYYSISGLVNSKPGDLAYGSRVATPAKIGYGLSLLENIIATSLIAARIIYTTRRSSAALPHKHSYYGILAVVVESAALYTIISMTYVGIYASKSNAQYIIFTCMCQVVGIVPTLIIVRIGLGITRYGGWAMTEDNPSIPRSRSKPVMLTYDAESSGSRTTSQDPES